MYELGLFSLISSAGLQRRYRGLLLAQSADLIGWRGLYG